MNFPRFQRRDPTDRYWLARVLDALGRLATLAALAFIVYGFVVEGHRSAAIKAEATKARATAARVGELGRQNQALLAQIQSGRRLSLITVCKTSNEERAASRAILKRFHIPSEDGLQPINCRRLLEQSNANSELP